jgi:DNA-binding PadR family transcriptional regulator
MANNLIANLLNPTLAKLILEIQKQGQLTAGELLNKFPDVSQPTMYRYLKALIEDGTLKIVSEKRVRGTVEKTYAIAADFQEDAERIVAENDGEGYLGLFTSYIMSVMSEFRAYCSLENIDIMRDGSGFTTAPVYATTEELQAALLKIGETIQELLKNEKTDARKPHSICIITTPPKIMSDQNTEGNKNA